ncbi:flagellar motor switch phosphatase FliY [Thermosediminibacter oceani]|uniref:CheC, inhibitor of MCP methylation / FliN fusion protein n=1 Tax=Thermosediminibacter oceani (strain ATCC BAA-1034 / DSM 16646 / JW/IW-1228P) TaxID=555079 RepID=D9S394_THEOJ|nr:flagellar motor switch phosphatase FliY [Thermosediminibacter oceani]ADL07871.1 CheC, inhibitor of MCP methylation / FliN fusion protein [Thermosediminibacter oceani DSM 16646]
MDENRILSQEEINELLNKSLSNQDEGEFLSQEEIDALGEIGNISIGTSATTLYTLLRNKVTITTPDVALTTVEKLQEKYSIPFIAIIVDHTEGIEGSSILIMKEEDAKIIADLMMGGDGRNTEVELDELRLSAVGEAMNQMMGSSATSLSTMLKKNINISPPTLKRVNFADETLQSYFKKDEKIVKISFKMEVGDLIESEIMLLMTIPFAKKLVRELMSISKGIPFETSKSDDTDEHILENAPPEPQKPFNEKKAEKVSVKPVELEDFGEAETSGKKSSLDLIMDVPLEISVELGRTVKKIKEILEIGPGSIIELEKLAGEPVDILVNGKLIARGEVVVIDESFGVRITEILNSIEKVHYLQ